MRRHVGLLLYINEDHFVYVSNSIEKKSLHAFQIIFGKKKSNKEFEQDSSEFNQIIERVLYFHSLSHCAVFCVTRTFFTNINFKKNETFK